MFSACSSEKVIWESKNSNVPDSFVYLFFPNDSKTEMFKKEGNSYNPTGIFLTRAFMCSQKELSENSYIEINHNNEKFYVPIKNVTPNPEIENREIFLKNLNLYLSENKKDDTASSEPVKLTFSKDTDIIKVVLIRTDNRNRKTKYFYTYKNNEVTADKLTNTALF